MQSSRQKKRTSQQKKRYHERAKKTGGAEGSTERTDKLSATADTVQRKTSSSKVVESSPSKQLGSYRDAADIEDRQKCPTPVQNKCEKESVILREEPHRLQEELEEDARKKEEEQLQQRLVQLLSMPVQHDPLPHPPVITSITSSLTSSILTLDCNSLADSLSTLPLHDRLNINHTLLDLDDLPPLDESSGMYITSKDEAQIRSRIDLTVCSKKNKPERFEFDKMTANLKLQMGCQSSNTRALAGSVSSQLVVSKASTDDVELQKLLDKNLSVGTGLSSQQSLASSAVATHPTTEENVPESSHTDKMSFSETDVKSAISGVSSMEEVKEIIVEDTDELDDMLDELLS